MIETAIEELTKQLKNAPKRIEGNLCCDSYLSSRMQRIRELEEGNGFRGTNGYLKAGCYECSGFDERCIKNGKYSTYSHDMDIDDVLL